MHIINLPVTEDIFETKDSDLNIYVVVHTMYFYDTSW